MVAAHASPGLVPLSANQRWKSMFGALLGASITIASIAHLIIFSLSPRMSVELFPPGKPPIQPVAPPVAQPLPPPPDEIARPAIPVPSDLALDLDRTIPAMDESWTRSDLPLIPPTHTLVPAEERAFTPVTANPRLSEAQRAELQRDLERRYPLALRIVGISASIDLAVHIDASRSVLETRVATSSGFPEFDAIAGEAMERMRFSPAMKRDVAVPIWIAMTVRFQSR